MFAMRRSAATRTMIGRRPSHAMFQPITEIQAMALGVRRG
jgi:hypothetical protein